MYQLRRVPGPSESWDPLNGASEKVSFSFIREGVKKRVFYAQADRKGLPPTVPQNRGA